MKSIIIACFLLVALTSYAQTKSVSRVNEESLEKYEEAAERLHDLAARFEEAIEMIPLYEAEVARSDMLPIPESEVSRDEEGRMRNDSAKKRRLYQQQAQLQAERGPPPFPG